MGRKILRYKPSLVGGFNPFEKIFLSNLIISPGMGENKKSAGLAGVSSGMGLDDGLLVCTLLLLI